MVSNCQLPHCPLPRIQRSRTKTTGHKIATQGEHPQYSSLAYMNSVEHPIHREERHVEWTTWRPNAKKIWMWS